MAPSKSVGDPRSDKLARDRVTAAVTPKAPSPLVERRAWGYYIVLHPPHPDERYKVKKLVLEAGKSTSLQYHFHRAEYWVIVHGTAEVTQNGASRVLYEGDTAYIAPGDVHRLKNIGKTNLVVIETQYGSYCEEDDIVRLPSPEVGA